MKTKLLLYIVCSLFFWGELLAQDPPPTIVKQNYTLNSGQSQSYTATQSITLKPTTWIKAGSTFSAKVVSDAYIPIVVSNTQNYILTRSYQKAMTSSTGITENKDVIDRVVYYDGLGHPMQEVAIKASGDKKDLITHIGYDQFGRQAKEYLPYRAGQNKGQYNTSALSQTNSFYNTAKYENTTNPYSEKVFEPSPLNRIEEVGAPGIPWKANPASDADHTIKYDYTTNGSSEVRLYRVSLTPDFTPSLTASGHYAPGELYVMVIKDENWKPADGDNRTTKEYKDKQGRVVLKRTYNSGAHDTYYVYDDYGNLTYVLPPKVNTGSSITATVLNELCYQYKYDERNRLVEKKIPGKGWEYIVYNMLDQPVLTQDAKLNAQDKWLFTKYDAFGRVVYTGTLNHTGSRTALQNSANNTTAYDQYEVRTPTANTYAGTLVYYSNEAIPKGLNDEILTINYYDNYTFDLAGLTKPTTVLGQTVDTRTKTLATGSKVRVLGTNHWITTISAYDKKGRLIYTATKNPYLNTTDIVESKLDFAGKVLETKTTHTKGSNAAIVTVDKFKYDHMGRLLDQTQKINNQAEELIAENVYDELGQLEQKKVGNTKSKPLQTISYAYNVRGWLKDINDVSNIGTDLFSFKINYNNPANGTALFNGNISETAWKTKNTDQSTKFYTYSYDALNRITAALDNTSKFNLSLVGYDKNGNILNLIRKGNIVKNPVLSNSQNYGTMDNLTYTYDSGNKLVKVTDSGNKTYGFKDGTNTGNDYSYDTNGNLLTDVNKGITGITYNHLNLPTQVNFGSNKIAYIYDALGVKLKKTVTQGSSVTGMEYAGNYIYENGQLQFFSHPEGYVTKENNSYKYVYQYKDHLGNVRLSYANIGTTSALQLEIIEENNYYPFGLQHKGYNNVVNGTEYNYKTYQGQEINKELGLNWLSFKWRNYDPAIGRFMSIDPLTEEYTDWSPYVFSGNRVIDARELEGLEPYIVTGRTFIPDKTISNPNPLSKTKSFAGDNRSNYQVNTTAYRTEQKVRVDFDNNKATTLSNRANSTTGYDKNGNVTETSTPGKAGPTPTYTMKDGTATVNMEVDASNKLVDSAPAINYEVGVTITQNKDGSFSFELTGESDGFPAYEFFITNEKDGKSYLMHGSNPNETGDSPFSLFPPMEKDINTRGNSNTTTPIEEEKKP